MSKVLTYIQGGDVIALIAQRMNVSQFESAKIILNDFNLSNEKLKITTKPQIKITYSECEQQTIRLLNQYSDYLKYLIKIFAPKDENETVNDIWVESIHKQHIIQYYLDLLTFEPMEVRQAFLKEYAKQLDDIEIKLDVYKRIYGRIGR